MIRIDRLQLNIANTDHITNSYIVYDDTNEAIVIDPGDEFVKIRKKIEQLKLNVKYILLTHAHFDHINAVKELQDYTNSMILVNKNDYDMLLGNVDNASSVFGMVTKKISKEYIQIVDDKESILVGKLKFELIHTPGHTAGSMVIYNRDENIAFTGDTLFADSYGRCDLATGNFNHMVKSLKNLFDIFNEDTTIYPGHGKESKISKTKKYISLLLAIKQIKL